MLPALALWVLAGAPDAGAAWKVTYETSLGIDHGNGRIVGTEEFTRVLTPDGLEEQASRTTTASDPKLPPRVTKEPPRRAPISKAAAEGITALLPPLAGLAGTYSFSSSVDDEGWDSKSLTVEAGGRVLRFSLVQGTQAKPMPKPVSRLLGWAVAPEEKAACPARMAWVKGGTFTLETRAVTVADFCLDFTEVTVEAYGKHGLGHSTEHSEEQDHGEEPVCNWGHRDRLRHPINCVDWNEARAYCQQEGKRLPADAEWEWAARGGAKGWTYPWGNTEPGARACWKGEGKRTGTCPVATHPTGVSPEGVEDLAGNVAEWTVGEDGAEYQPLRGGSWFFASPAILTATFSGSDPVSNRRSFTGFRCAR